MILQNSKLNNLFIKLKSDDVQAVLHESLTTIDTLLELDTVLLPMSEYFEKHGPVEDFPYFQLETLEKFLYDTEYSSISGFSTALSSSEPVCNRRAKDSVLYIGNLKNTLQAYCTAYVPLTDAEVLSLKQNVAEILGQLAYFVYLQFGFENILRCFLDGKEIEIDVNFYTYSNKRSVDFRNIILKIKGVVWSYRPHLDIFDEFPELEEEFYDIAGPYVTDFEKLEMNLTKDFVLSVINGECDVEEMIKRVEDEKED